jgi:uroporphyrinogen-III synthase
MMPVLIVRPEPGASVTLGAARTYGLDAHSHPIFEVRPVPWEAPPREEIDALLIGSANALRHGGVQIERYEGLPAYAVGEMSALAAQSAGLAVVARGNGGLQAVLDSMDGAHPRLLRLAGRARVPLAPPPGISIRERIVYASEPLSLSAAALPLLSGRALVLLHSGEAARHFGMLCDRAGITRERIEVAGLGPRITELAGSGWARTETAPNATDGALLALARQMCQDA